jgi:hypothetical protein
MLALEPTVEPSMSVTGHDPIQRQWSSISDRLQRRWRKLTPDDVLFAGGSAEYLARVLQDRYGVDRREARLQVHEFESAL